MPTTAIPPKDLATFTATPDGNLEVELNRFGRLTIKLPNTVQTIEVIVIRDKEKNFGCFVITDVAGDEKKVAAALKKNKGERPSVVYRLSQEGQLDVDEAMEKTVRDQAVGLSAREAAEDETPEPPAGTEASEDETKI